MQLCRRHISVCLRSKLKVSTPDVTELDIAWFEMNYMKLNTNKCHLLLAGRNEILNSFFTQLSAI